MTSASNSTYWNLIQTLGWICLRDNEFTNDAEDGAHKGRWIKRRFKTPDGETKTVEEPDTPHNIFSILVEAELSDVPLLCSIEQAASVLIQALQISDIFALGLRNGEGDLEEVPVNFWTDAKFYFEPDMAAPKDFLRRGASCWKELRFPAHEMRRLWPSREPKQVTTDREAPPRLTFKLIAARWLMEQPDTGQTADDLAADLIAVAEAGHFTSRRGTISSSDAHFDHHLQKEIYTFGPDLQPATPDEIEEFTFFEGASKIHARRSTAARDLTVSLPILIKWTESADGKIWLRTRGLRAPAYVLKLLSAEPQPALGATVRGEKQCTEWLLKIMRSGDQEQPKSYYKAEATTKFRVSKRGFGRAWDIARTEANNPSWGRPGPKSSRVNRIAK